MVAPSRDEYDAIVIGSGLGGLSTGAHLARAGERVLVIERGDGPGGCAHAFRRGDYLIDPAIHIISQAGEGFLLDASLQFLGVRDRVTMLELGDLYAARFPDFSMHVPIGLEEYIAAHTALLPDHAETVERFFRLVHQIHHELHELPPQLNMRDLDAVVQQFPMMFKYSRATLQEAMDELLPDPRAQAICAAGWPYMGVPPSRLSFLTYCQATSAHLESPRYCKGSFQQLADAFVAALEMHGGELLLNTQVGKITIEDGRATGVTLATGQEVRAKAIVSNADARHTFEELVGEDRLPAPFMKRLRRMTPSLSACALYAATTLDLTKLDVAYETFIYKHWDHQQTYDDILAGQPGAMWLTVPTLLDPSLAPPGEHLVILTSLAAYDIGEPWEEAKPRFTEALLGELTAMFPGIRDHLTFTEVATPPTFERYTLNSRGAIYGWEFTPLQSGSKRMPHHTPVAGLFLAGHWTLPGASSLRVFVSGVHAAQIVLAESGKQLGLEHRDLPPI